MLKIFFKGKFNLIFITKLAKKRSVSSSIVIISSNVFLSISFEIWMIIQNADILHKW